MIETWATIPGTDGLYDVSTHGRVRSYSDRHRGRLAKPHLLKYDPGPRGHLRVSLTIDGTVKRFLVHRLVLSVFSCPPPFAKAQAAHLDGNPANNHFGNLKWCTCRENHSHRAAHGTDPRGERSHTAILTNADVRYIFQNPDRLLQCDLAKRFGVHRSAIYLIRTGKNWSHLTSELAENTGDQQ